MISYTISYMISWMISKKKNFDIAYDIIKNYDIIYDMILCTMMISCIKAMILRMIS
jgi:hypothetical protein